MNQEDKTFSTGHVVHLRSGSPPLTIVCDNAKGGPIESPDRIVIVSWFENATPREATFPIKALDY